MPDTALPIPANETAVPERPENIKEMRVTCPPDRVPTRAHKRRFIERGCKGKGTRAMGTAGHTVPRTASIKGPPIHSTPPSPLRTDEHATKKPTRVETQEAILEAVLETPVQSEAPVEEEFDAELIIEDFTIDGICGVY